VKKIVFGFGFALISTFAMSNNSVVSATCDHIDTWDCPTTTTIHVPDTTTPPTTVPDTTTPTTVVPTTVAPTTVVPTTVAPTTVPPTTVVDSTTTTSSTTSTSSTTTTTQPPDIVTSTIVKVGVDDTTLSAFALGLILIGTGSLCTGAVVLACRR